MTTGTAPRRATSRRTTPSPTERLEALARDDPSVAPLVRLHVVAQRAAADPAWDAGMPALDRQQVQAGIPLLHGQTVTVDTGSLHRLAHELAGVAAETSPGGRTLRSALRAGTLEPATLLVAALRQDHESMVDAGAAAGVDADLLEAWAQLLAMPVLRAAGRAAAPLLEDVTWDAGYCPVCAAWPLLAERRGLERTRVLRCGRCGAGWSYGLQKCVYCANADYKTLGYLAPESQREARQAATCDACMSYLKTITTVSALAPEDLPIQDLVTLELDIAALGQGYTRPEQAGFPLGLQVVAPPPAAPKRESLLPWPR